MISDMQVKVNSDSSIEQTQVKPSASPLRITYLHQYFIPPAGSGGTRSYEFARRLIAKGHNVRMITSSSYLPEEYQSLTQRVTYTEIAGIPTTVIQVHYTNDMGVSDRMKAFIKFAIWASWEAMKQPADVIFATSTPLTIAFPGIIAKLWRRVPMVFEVRDLWPELPIAIGALKNPLAQRIAKALEWIAYHSSSKIVALSPGMAQGVIDRGIDPADVTTIPNSCDLALFDVPPERGQSIRDRLGDFAHNRSLVVYCGTFGIINGASYLVDIAAAMQDIDPDLRFLLVGRGAERDKIISKAEEHGILGKNVQVWDPIAKQEMPNLLAAATVATSQFIDLPAMQHNSANKFFDALAAGKPIAINYGGWQADLLRESGAGIVMTANNPAQAAKELADFVADKEKLAQAAVASRNLANTQFHRDLMAEKLEAALIQAVTSSGK